MKITNIEHREVGDVKYAYVTFSTSAWRKAIRYAGCNDPPDRVRRSVEYQCAKKAHEAYRDGLFEKYGDDWRLHEQFTIDEKARWAKVISWRLLGPEQKPIWSAIIELRDALYESHRKRALGEAPD